MKHLMRFGMGYELNEFDMSITWSGLCRIAIQSVNMLMYRLYSLLTRLSSITFGAIGLNTV